MFMGSCIHHKLFATNGRRLRLWCQTCRGHCKDRSQRYKLCRFSDLSQDVQDGWVSFAAACDTPTILDEKGHIPAEMKARFSLDRHLKASTSSTQKHQGQLLAQHQNDLFGATGFVCQCLLHIRLGARDKLNGDMDTDRTGGPH